MTKVVRQLSRSFSRFAVMFLCLFVLANCASAPEGDPEALAEYHKINDPAEPTNRAIYKFNDVLDKAVIKPVTGVYRAIFPDPIREAIHNFLQNLRTPVILANDLLQGEMAHAGDTIARFVINTTFGIFGFIDQAEAMGFEPHDEDFGQTLAVWGVGEGPYLMVPLFGPSNPRDLVGKVVDWFFDPINWWAANTDNDWVPLTRTIISGIDTRDQLWDALEDIEKSSIDPYASIRSLYRQRRADEIRNGESSDAPAAPDLGEDMDMDDPEENAEKGG
ncbi:MAG: MlaA family lipoprotein [Rhodospirillaceae bacterium]